MRVVSVLHSNLLVLMLKTTQSQLQIGAILSKKIGYKQIDPAFDEPQEGDIYIIHRTRNHVYGHIAGYTGSEWVSDFKQNSYDVYKDDSVTYTYIID